MSDSQAVRLALVEARSRRRRRVALREEAQRLAADPDDLRELVAIGAELDGLTPAWPEE